jgi:hypothetical protein
VFAPPPQRRRSIGALVALLVGLLVMGGIGFALARGGSGSGGSAGEDDPGRVYRVGEPADLGSLTFTVTGVRTIPPSEFVEPVPGQLTIAVHIEAVNNSESSKLVSSLGQFALRDATGLTYQQTFAEGLVGSLDGTIPPGSRLRGEIAYDVPEGITGLQLVISNFLFAGSVTVQLN